MYTLEKSCRILTRDYAHQLGLTPIDYDLPRQQWHNTQLNGIDQDSTKTNISQSGTPCHQTRNVHRETTRTNTIRILIPVGGFDEPPSPTKSPPDSPRLSSHSIYLDSEETNIAGVAPGGGGNPPNPQPNPPLPWLRTSTLVVPGVQHPLPKHPYKLLPKFNPHNIEPAKVH